jgi:hypothetical protein
MKKMLPFLLLFAAIHAAAQEKTMPAGSGKPELVDQVKTDYSWCDGMLVDRHVTIKAGKECWTLLLDKDQTNQGAKWYRNMGYAITYFAKHMGWGDLTGKDGYDYGDKEKQNEMEQIANPFKNKISFTLDAAGMPCTKLYYELMMRYTGSISDFLENPPYHSGVQNWKPKSGEMHITLIMSNKVKDLAVTTDGKNFTITAPYIAEPVDWGTKLKKGLTKGGN